jgi:hypothetical protein
MEINVPRTYTVEPDQEGRFSFKVYAGLNILISARVKIKDEFYSGFAEVSATGEDIKVKLVIPR